MVLRDDDESAESARLARADDLVRIEGVRIQHRGILVAESPFAVGIGVETPMYDAVDLAVARRDACGQRGARFRNLA
jgi:hypothetical protein